MGFLYEKGNVGYEKTVGFAIKDPGLICCSFVVFQQKSLWTLACSSQSAFPVSPQPAFRSLND